MKRTLAAVAATALLLTGSAALATGAQAAPTTHSQQTVQVAKKKKPKVYKNCTALNKDYKHGLRKKGGKDVVRGETDPVPTKLIPIRTKIYKVNTKLDRDKDGVACEKH